MTDRDKAIKLAVAASDALREIDGLSAAFRLLGQQTIAQNIDKDIAGPLRRVLGEVSV